jgi:cell division transport system permease protein
VPRLIVVRIASGGAANLAQLRQLLAEQVAGASLDDHRAWIDQMRAMAHASVAGGIGVLALMLVATVLSVMFATRGAMAINRPIVEVLHFIGAKDGFIAGQFQRHFLALGLEGGAIGGGAAILLFALAGFARDWMLSEAVRDQFALLFGAFSIGVEGYLAVAAQIALIALVTAATSRQTVNRTLAMIE